MKMEFMGGKKTPQLPALGEGQKQETDPGAFLAHRIQAGLSRAASALGTGQAAAQRVHSDIIPPGTWNASPLPECHHSSGGQSCVLQRKLLTPALSQHHLWCAGAEKPWIISFGARCCSSSLQKAAGKCCSTVPYISCCPAPNFCSFWCIFSVILSLLQETRQETQIQRAQPQHAGSAASFPGINHTMHLLLSLPPLLLCPTGQTTPTLPNKSHIQLVHEKSPVNTSLLQSLKNAPS